MKNPNTTNLRLSLPCFLFMVIPFAAHSQKLPKVQTASIRAPANIKIDGKTTEWDNTFQAYNHATSLFYTMANDDDNLYITVQANDMETLTKITGAGILFNINTSEKRGDKDAVSINYPFFEKNGKPFINFKNNPKIVPGSAASVITADSLMKARNKLLDNKSKYIVVKGIPGIDTMLSVYNEEGIKAREAFNNAMAYTCELAIPLKYLNLSVNNRVKFVYHILLPGLKLDDLGIIVDKTADGSVHLTAAPGAGAALLSKDHLNAIYATTDFWGEYTLAKK